MAPLRSIVWAPIPCLSSLFPMIGHFGITDSVGVIHDFGGDFYVNRSETHTIFGPPTLYTQLSEEYWSVISDEEWDSALSMTITKYQKKRYNFFINNCHHFVAAVLKTLSSGEKKYTILSLIRAFRLSKAVRQIPDRNIPLTAHSDALGCEDT